jgi:hypothetical protein
MISKSDVDKVLIDWGTAFFNRSPVSSLPGSKSGMTGVPLVSKEKHGRAGTTSQSVEAHAIRSKLGSIARKSPEVLVKISGGGKGMRQIKAHLDYISRNGKIDLENEEGEVLLGKEALQDLRKEWQDGGCRIAEESEKREAFNIVLSMPADTDEIAVKRAARDFAAEEFAGYQYVMAHHTFDSDPDEEPSKNPHVHLAVKAQGADGRRLNPRKADLQRWREGFAKALNDHGVEAAATRRTPRLQRQRGEKQEVRELKRRGAVLDKAGRSDASQERVIKAEHTEAQVIKSYAAISKALASSEDIEDRRLAIALVKRLQSDPNFDSVLRIPRERQMQQTDPSLTRKTKDIER